MDGFPEGAVRASGVTQGLRSRVVGEISWSFHVHG